MARTLEGPSLRGVRSEGHTFGTGLSARGTLDVGRVVGAALAAPGDITLVSTSDSGVKGNDSSFGGSLSADGTMVAFSSGATNLDPDDTDSFPDVYVKDLTTGDITLVSTSASGIKANGGGQAPSLSADGTRVAFYSSATNLDPADTDSLYDIYVKDLTTGDIVLASTSDSGLKANGDSGFPSLSGDATRVAFLTYATNLNEADDDVFVEDVYVKDLTTGDITLVSTSDEGVKANGSSSSDSSLSADGTRVAFRSDATNLDPADTDLTFDVYVKDLPTGNITLASTSDSGMKGDGASYEVSLSADGTRVAFRSEAANLDPADTDFILDVYVKDLATGDITLASTSDSGVKGNSDSDEPGLSPDGTRVALYSYATNLDGADTDSFTDVYVKDLATGDISLASTSDGGIKGNSDSSGGGLSADGTMVAFTSNATNLDPGRHRQRLRRLCQGPWPARCVGRSLGAEAGST